MKDFTDNHIEVRLEKAYNEGLKYPYFANIYINGVKKYEGRRIKKFNEWALLNLETKEVDYFLRGASPSIPLLAHLTGGFSKMFMYDRNDMEIYRVETVHLLERNYFKNTEIIFECIRSVYPVTTKTQFFEWDESIKTPSHCYKVDLWENVPAAMGYAFCLFVNSVVSGSISSF